MLMNGDRGEQQELVHDGESGYYWGRVMTGEAGMGRSVQASRLISCDGMDNRVCAQLGNGSLQFFDIQHSRIPE